MAKTLTTIRLSDEARQMQHALASKFGLTLTATLELAIRRLAEVEGLAPGTKPKRATRRIQVKAKTTTKRKATRVKVRQV